MNPGKWIVVAFVAFAVFIAALVTVCVREDVSLVSRQYYRDELMYNDQQRQLQRAAALPQPPSVHVLAGEVVVTFPEAVAQGRLSLQRPSQAQFDRAFSLDTMSVQRFRPDQWKPGLYRATLEWSVAGVDYRMEQTLVF